MESVDSISRDGPDGIYTLIYYYKNGLEEAIFM